MSFQILSINESISLVHDLSAVAQDLFENRQAKTSENPHQFLEGVNQLLFMAQQIDGGEAEIHDPLQIFLSWSTTACDCL